MEENFQTGTQSRIQQFPRQHLEIPNITTITVQSVEPIESRPTTAVFPAAYSSTNKLITTTNSLFFINNLLTERKMNDGPGIFKKQVIRYFKLHLEMCSRIGAISFCWDKEVNEFGALKNKKRYQFNMQMSIHIIHNIFLIWSQASRDMGKFGISYKMLCIYFNTGYILCNGLRIFAWMHEKEIVQLMNAHFKFQEKFRGN